MAGVCTRIALGALAALVVVLALPAASPAAINWRSCRAATGAECATAARAAGPHGRRLRGTVPLKLARLPADAARPTLVYLSGGPGGAGIEEMLAVMPLAPSLLDALPRRRLRPARHRRLRPAALPRARARPAAAQRQRRREVRAQARRGAAAVHDAGLGRGPRGDPRRARRRAPDAVRHLLRDRAGARLRPRAPRPRRPADPRLRGRSRRPRPVRPGRLPRDGPEPRRPLPGRLPRHLARADRARREAGRAAAVARPARDARSTAAAAATRSGSGRPRSPTCCSTPTTTRRCARPCPPP